MKLGKTILVLTVVWLTVITASHGVLNLRWLVRKTAGVGTQPEFGVGFLPVTCHLTCPVTDFINKNIEGQSFFQPMRDRKSTRLNSSHG